MQTGIIQISLAVVVVLTVSAQVSAESDERVGAQVEKELRSEGILLAEEGRRIDIDIDGDTVVVAVVVIASGLVLAEQRIGDLPADPDATVAHLTILVSAMLRRYEATPPRSVSPPSVAPVGLTEAPPTPTPTRVVAPRPADGVWFVGASIGRGAGYIVSGTSESTDSPVGCCLALDATSFRFEAGLWLSPRWALSAVGRLGMTRANVPGHATYAPALLARVTRSTRPRLGGWSFHVDTGVGLIRHDLEIADQDPGENIDTHAAGPLIVGTGGRYAIMLGSSAQVFIDASGYLAVNLADEFGGVRPGTAAHLELAVGFAFAQ